MLKIKTISDQPADVRVYEIHSDGVAASADDLDRISRVADQLVEENRVGGRFVAAENGILELHIPFARRTFFHDGIVFAALDAVNDPVRSPTLTRLAACAVKLDGEGPG